MVVSEHELTTHEQLCSHLRTISCTIELHNLTSVYTPSSHYHSVFFCIILPCQFVLCCGNYGVGLVCVLVWFVGPDKKLDCILPQEPSYSLLSPDISQVATCLPQKLSDSLKIFKTEAKSQHAFSKQEPSYNLHSRQVTEFKLQPHSSDRTKVQPAFTRQNQSTACIHQT